jgi:hypothetical protein
MAIAPIACGWSGRALAGTPLADVQTTAAAAPTITSASAALLVSPPRKRRHGRKLRRKPAALLSRRGEALYSQRRYEYDSLGQLGAGLEQYLETFRLNKTSTGNVKSECSDERRAMTF